MLALYELALAGHSSENEVISIESDSSQDAFFSSLRVSWLGQDSTLQEIELLTLRAATDVDVTADMDVSECVCSHFDEMERQPKQRRLRGKQQIHRLH